jgi:hypothetical protein
MTQDTKTFKTAEVLAAIHSFPGLLAAAEKIGVLEAFDKIRERAPEIAGMKGAATDHLGWCTLSQAMRPVLKSHFPALSAEQFPDQAYWSDPRKLDAEKVSRLGDWVHQMETKYGATLQVPDIGFEVKEELELLHRKAPKPF